MRYTIAMNYRHNLIEKGDKLEGTHACIAHQRAEEKRRTKPQAVICQIYQEEIRIETAKYRVVELEIE